MCSSFRMNCHDARNWIASVHLFVQRLNRRRELWNGPYHHHLPWVMTVKWSQENIKKTWWKWIQTSGHSREPCCIIRHLMTDNSCWHVRPDAGQSTKYRSVTSNKMEALPWPQLCGTICNIDNDFSLSWHILFICSIVQFCIFYEKGLMYPSFPAINMCGGSLCLKEL